MKEFWENAGKVLAAVAVCAILLFGGSKIYKSVFDDGYQAGIERGKAMGEAMFTGRLLIPENGKALDLVVVGVDSPAGVSGRDGKQQASYYDTKCSSEYVGKKVVIINGSCRLVEGR